jgi:hypothetical protein
MTPAAKATYFAALAIGLLIGAIRAFRATNIRIERNQNFRQRAAPFVLDDFSYMQYRHADTEHGIAALQTYAAFLEEMENQSPNKSQKYELASTYTRLALLEDDARNPDQSGAYMTKAWSWYTAAGGQAHSEAELKAGRKALDERVDR